MLALSRRSTALLRPAARGVAAQAATCPPPDAREPVIIIGGGMGPAASAKLHDDVLENTLTSGLDAEHVTIMHVSRPVGLVDRTAFLLGQTEGDSPADLMLDNVGAMVKGAEHLGLSSVIGVPCNTFHAPPLWDVFSKRVGEELPSATLLSMLDELVDYTRAVIGPGEGQRVAITGTIGARHMAIHAPLLQAAGYEPVHVTDEEQLEVHAAIVDPAWGLKADTHSPKAIATFERIARRVRADGADALLLGCTEIPLALPGMEFEGMPLLDPLVALARALIREVNPARLVPRPTASPF